MTELPKHACSSCGRLTVEYSEFKCPRCRESTIHRCYACRETHVSYKCPKCSYEGP